MFTPEIRSNLYSGRGLLDGSGWSKTAEHRQACPPELFAQLNARSNLVYYDWEMTQAKLHHWVYLGQTARLAFWAPANEA